MSYDDDLQAIPTLCDACYARLKETPPSGGKVLLFRCGKCKYEFCLHLDHAEGTKLCVGCADEIKAEQHGPVDWM